MVLGGERQDHGYHRDHGYPRSGDDHRQGPGPLSLYGSLWRNRKDNAVVPGNEGAAVVAVTEGGGNDRAWEREALGRDGDGRRLGVAWACHVAALWWEGDWKRDRSVGADRVDIRGQQKMNAGKGTAEADESPSAGGAMWLAAVRWHQTTRPDAAVCYLGMLDPCLCIVDRARDTQAHSRG